VELPSKLTENRVPRRTLASFRLEKPAEAKQLTSELLANQAISRRVPQN
jgi:hypothetical protein